MPKEKEKFLLIQPKGAVLKNYPTANRVKIRVLKNKVTGKGFREAFIYVRPNFGIDENMSIRELAVSYGLIESDGGKKWYIGKSSEDAIVSYSSKTELIEDIVIKQNPEVLGKLRGMVIDRVTTDDTERFIGRLSPSELAYVTEPEAGFADEEFFEEGVPAPELPEGAVKDFKVEELE
jgi:hypothetical protein